MVCRKQVQVANSGHTRRTAICTVEQGMAIRSANLWVFTNPGYLALAPRLTALARGAQFDRR